MNVLNALKQKNISVGYLYFYIHFVTEVVCFYFMSKIIGDSYILWILPLLYDVLAFVPQSLIGYICDKTKVNAGIIGVILLFISFLVFNLNIINQVFPLIFLCIGNCFLHISGAEKTLKTSNGKLSHSAIFVAGGSFGVVTGKLLAKYGYSYILCLILIITMIPFILLADTYKEETCDNFNYENKNISKTLVIILAVIVVIIRGYMGYGIPTTWNKTDVQLVMLYLFMGIGKALGGIVSDSIGFKKTIKISTLLSIPFLIFGDNIMFISLIGVMLFSMTMALTLALLVSVLKNTPGLAFGHTTIGLFLGTLPIFFIRIKNFNLTVIFIIASSLICYLILNYISKGDKNV